MSEDRRQLVEAESSDFKRGFDAGLNSAADAKNPPASNEPGQELKDRDEQKRSQPESTEELLTPLFLRDSPEGNKGNAQDEKDAASE